MSSGVPLDTASLCVKVRERSMGLFYWVVTRQASSSHDADIGLKASDHPYPTHEAAQHAGAACLRAFARGPLP